MKRKIILYIASSLDGFIARKNGSVDWLDKFNSPGEDYGYKDFLLGIDVVIMGNKTYRQVLTFGDFPYKDKKCFVFSPKAGQDENVTFVNGEVNKFFKSLNSKSKKDIWLVGGANLIKQFLKYDMIDEFIISVIPVILGEGINLFATSISELNLTLDNVRKYDSGIVQMSYSKK